MPMRRPYLILASVASVLLFGMTALHAHPATAADERAVGMTAKPKCDVTKPGTPAENGMLKKRPPGSGQYAVSRRRAA